ncbi:MAG TPA: S46 family peptidase [Caulobacteraceae bacterium]|jgi:hypothetical protein
MFRRLPAVLAAAALLAVPAAADEGMWTFDNFPIQQVNRAYGTKLDQAWLDRVRGAAVRIPGCSASVVSPEGLLLTNYHCVESCAGNLSTPQTDYFATGYRTRARTDEKQCPGMWAEVLQTIEDVTPRMQRALADKAGAARVQAVGTEGAAIEKERCGTNARMRCQVIGFYGGGQYKLYTFNRYDDVRLVFAPEFKTGFFGGDPDNFNFPRFNLDASFLRVYADGKPVSTPAHLKWNPAPPKAGEPIFVVGNPGTTQRQLTTSQLAFLRDVSLTPEQLQRSELRGKLLRIQQERPEGARLVSDTLIGLENSFKVYYGRQRALADQRFFGSKVREEQDLRAKVAADPALKASVGDPWTEVERAQATYAQLYPAYYFLETNAGSGSKLFGWARTLVRGAQERAKPAGERLPEFAEGNLPLIARGLGAETKTEPQLEELYLSHWLSKTREYLGPDDPATRLLLGRDSPEAKARALVSGSKLADPAVRQRLWEGGLAAVQASDDPLIRLALAMDPAAREIRTAVNQQVTGPVSAARERISRARFAAYGQNVYPDATFSPRVTYGQVTGWTERGRPVPPFTTFRGLFERVTGQPPYDLPQSWFAARPRLNMDTVFNFSGSTDIIGGASGSPTLNARGEVIGAVFDGNIHSLGGAFGYDPELNRSVHVASSAIQEALLKVYEQPHIVQELNRHTVISFEGDTPAPPRNRRPGRRQ